MSSLLDPVVKETFDGLLVELGRIVGADAYARWLRGIDLIAFQRGVMTIGAPNVFVRDWIVANYLGLMIGAAAKAYGTTVGIDVVVAPRIDRSPAAGGGSMRAPKISEHSHPTGEWIKTIENRFASAACDYIVERRLPRMSPLFVVGPSGTGKSHLLSTLTARLARSSEPRNVVDFTANTFTSRFAMALKTRTMASFRDQMQAAEVFVMDEVHRLRRRMATQQELVTLIEQFDRRGVQLVFGSRHSPSEVHELMPGLASCLGRGLVVRIDGYSPASLRRIHKSTCADATRHWPDDVIDAVAKTAGGSVRVLRERLAKLYEYSVFSGERPDLDFCRRNLLEIAGRTDDTGDILLWIVEIVAKRYGATRDEVMSKKKLRRLAMPRAVLVCILRDVFNETFGRIGRLLGGRSHAAIHQINSAYGSVVREGAEAANFRELSEIAGRCVGRKS
jgi:chromosomal replication initiator protein DnaA